MAFAIFILRHSVKPRNADLSLALSCGERTIPKPRPEWENSLDRRLRGPGYSQDQVPLGCVQPHSLLRLLTL